MPTTHGASRSRSLFARPGLLAPSGAVVRVLLLTDVTGLKRYND